MRRAAVLFFWGACSLAAAWPWVQSSRLERETQVSRAEMFPGWPELFEGKPWIQLRSPEGRAGFSGGFAGKTAVFSQGDRLVVLRWITEASRAVHPSADCFRASGYKVERSGLVRDAEGRSWTEFVARREGEAWQVRERLAATPEHGDGWSDVSAWYWAAQRADQVGPWWAMTIAVPLEE